jgi:hypothetical protein
MKSLPYALSIVCIIYNWILSEYLEIFAIYLKVCRRNIDGDKWKKLYSL